MKENRFYFLYLIFDSGTYAYAGEISNIFWRATKHKDKCSAGAVIYLQEYQDKEEVLRLEKHFIHILKPKLNNR